MFEILKNHSAFSRFQTGFSTLPAFTYDVCFNNWPLDTGNYKTQDFKHWYAQVEKAIGDQNILFDFWCSEHHDDLGIFVEKFITLFNMIAERNEVDALPPVTPMPEDENNNCE